MFPRTDRPSSTWLVLPLLALALIVGVGDTSATSAIPQTLSDLSDNSTHIVRGDVRHIASRWNADRTLIVTDVSLWVGDSFKGAAGGEILITLPGGQIDDLVLDVVGAPTFYIEEEVLVFLQRGEDDNFLLPTLFQGKFHITTDADGTTWLSNDHSTLPQLLPGRAASLQSGSRMPLDIFLNDLTNTLRGGGTR